MNGTWWCACLYGWVDGVISKGGSSGGPGATKQDSVCAASTAGDNANDVADALLPVPRIQGSSNGRGQARHRLCWVCWWVAGHHCYARPPVLQNYSPLPHAHHIREEVTSFGWKQVDICLVLFKVCNLKFHFFNQNTSSLILLDSWMATNQNATCLHLDLRNEYESYRDSSFSFMQCSSASMYLA